MGGMAGNTCLFPGPVPGMSFDEHGTFQIMATAAYISCLTGKELLKFRAVGIMTNQASLV
jgi:hypothetical protein